MIYTKIRDIQITEDFSYDYENAPRTIQKRVDKLVRMILEGGKIPPSMNPHKSAEEDSEVWIGYVTVNKGSWRMLFQEDLTDVGIIILDRLVSHAEMDDII
jgi:hypothetical protein